jgi:hypothetical protein
MVADDPDKKIELKAFCAEIVNHHRHWQKNKLCTMSFPPFQMLVRNSL